MYFPASICICMSQLVYVCPGVREAMGSIPRINLTYYNMLG